MGEKQRGGSGGATGVVIGLIALGVLAVPCLIGGVLLVGLFSFRSVAVPAPPPRINTYPAPAVPPPVASPQMMSPPTMLEPAAPATQKDEEN